MRVCGCECTDASVWMRVCGCECVFEECVCAKAAGCNCAGLRRWGRRCWRRRRRRRGGMLSGAGVPCMYICMSSPEGLGLIRLCAAVEKPRAFPDRANRGRGPRPQTLRTSVIPNSARAVLRINCHLRILHAKYLLDSGAAPRPSRIQLLQYRLTISKHSRSRAPRARTCWHINRRLV